jgi:hypothetical protein
MNFCKKRTKKITFDYIVNVVLIPCSKEMDVEMKTLLWWNNKELKWFGISAMDELETFLLYNSHLNRKHAMKYLYQPEYNNC